MSGKLLFVSGLSGAGKTTLIGAALKSIPELHYLRTVTTRPPRADENDSFEYEFVDDKTYETRRAASKNWDHTDYQGHKYGADVGAVQQLLASGQTVICAVAPDLIIIGEMAEHYGVAPIKIWIDTPAVLAKTRIQDDEDRLSRAENERVKNAFDFVFHPIGKLNQDKKEFVKIVRAVVTRNK